MIYGNTEGIRNTILEKLEEIYNMEIAKDEICSKELISILAYFTDLIGREISIAINRRGNIESITLGDSSTVELPILEIKERKLSGIRIVHTHPNGNSTLSSLDLSALLKLKLDCIAAIGVMDGKVKDTTVGFCDVQNDSLKYNNSKKLSVDEFLNINILERLEYIEDIIKSSKVEEDYGEKAIIVGIENEESLDELAELVRACEVSVVGRIFQKKSKMDPALYIGSGKVSEVGLLAQKTGANVVIFDDELSGSQLRNLEKYLGIKAIDRTTLILEIFSKRAKSREGKIQVELAQLKYRLPRLIGMGAVLSRTGGGIGTRGPGEQKLETDRRHIKNRIYDLTKELEKIKKIRNTQRSSRNEIPKVSLVGYTNSGKSTLRNYMYNLFQSKELNKKDSVLEADMLFATLDTTTRAINLPDNRVITLTDTVGFIRKLPHDLVESFKSTLEEVIESDLLLHVVDISSDHYLEQIEAVNNVLEELNALHKPIILLINKIDKIDKNELEIKLENLKEHEYVCISAKQGINIDILLKEIVNKLPNKLKKVEYLIPYNKQDVVAYLHRNAKVNEQKYKDNGTYICAEVDELVYNVCNEYMIK
ncbi:GTPase HflX [Clostridium cochlearium]|uniref:GTPase HflX n=1 Tax=Clostridium cochlearium TaxID=1494 RepID=A0ABY0QL49_CLOCO|nr:GTPase HflX [Clostridium cochlearium]MCG4572060.1 GTPase HflX [Clostridium cochlearium]MCR1970836.1 GTPase HflX [Clostridium cochlearium]MDU1442127.1 GTPase HflX [Clostridium cochlearium]NMA58184.1 GTPase HflX [Clostridium cochlearium]SDL12802.1 GTP-binding protein HflX [Clostridium cochlearium]